MVIYEVNLSVKHEIYDEYRIWLVEHVNDILKFEGFLEAEIGIVETDSREKDRKLRVNYAIDNYQNLQNYLTLHAPQMRAQAKEKFGDQFSADRRIISDITVL